MSTKASILILRVELTIIAQDEWLNKCDNWLSKW
jgi:hypothetical protein